jgi:ubiquinone/menaquinone biosynthesis C-methylase UbiE
MHSFARRLHGSVEKSATKETKGLILNGGWRYDLMGWFVDAFLFRHQWRELRQKTADLASLQAGEKVLDVGCGTGTLAMKWHEGLAERVLL